MTTNKGKPRAARDSLTNKMAMVEGVRMPHRWARLFDHAFKHRDESCAECQEAKQIIEEGLTSYDK